MSTPAVTAPSSDVVVTEDVLLANIEAIRSQLMFLKRRITGDDLTARGFDNAMAGLDMLISDIDAVLAKETDDYNGLVDRAEAFQDSVNRAILAIGQLVGKNIALDDVGRALTEYLEAKEVEISNAQLLEKQARSLSNTAMTDLRRYQREYPTTLVDKLEKADKEIRGLKKERREARESLTEISKTLTQSRKAHEKDQKKLLEAQIVVSGLNEELNRLGNEMNMVCGMGMGVERFNILYNGQDSVAYLHSYPTGLTAMSSLRGEVLMTANFHYQIRTNRLITMDVVPSIWGVPVFYLISGFEKEWNTDIDKTLGAWILAQLERDYPRLHNRIMDAKAAPVDELVMRPETMAEIQKTSFDSVWSVACIPSSHHDVIPFMQGERRDEILNAVRVWANRWDKANGGVEELYDYR